MPRVYRKLRSAGQDVPRYNLQTAEFLAWGDNLIWWPTPFPLEQAEAAWEAYRDPVLAEWRDYWKCFRILPACFAQRVFDKQPQIPLPKADGCARSFIEGIELKVRDYLKGR